MRPWRHRGAALAAILTFLTGTTAIPVVHLLFHELPHQHEHGESQHGDGALAHFSVAVSDDAAAPFELAVAPNAPRGALATRSAPLLAAARTAVARFRGPPSPR